MASRFAPPLLTHRDPLSLASDDLVKSTESVDLQLGQLLVSHKLIEEKLDADEFGHGETFIEGYSHHEGQRHEHIGTDQLRAERKRTLSQEQRERIQD